MEPTRELIDAIFRDRILRARQIPNEQKTFAGLDLFDSVCHRMIAGIRHDFPKFSEEEVQHELRRRLRINRLVENSR
jgi:hypothetical protein